MARFGDLEAAIMDVVWATGAPVRVREVSDQLNQERALAFNTVQTVEAYALSLAPAARRVLAEGPPRGLPVAVAAAVTEFLTGALLDNPHRIGKPLAREPAEYHSARRGAYRVVYRIDEPARTVHVVRIDHRADVHGTR